MYFAPPILSFNIVDQSSGKDLFFSDNPLYQLADVKVYFNDHTNKPDSLTPRVLTKENGTKYFAFDIAGAPGTDTCMVKIKNLEADRLIYTIDRSGEATCGQPYISGVKVNNGAAIKLSPAREIIVIRK